MTLGSARRVRLAIAISHPIQYHAPLYAHLAQDGRFELRVFYMTDRGARAYYEPLARNVISHGAAVLRGYDHVFMRRGDAPGGWQRRTEDIKLRLAQHLVAYRPRAVYFHGYANPAYWWAILKCRRAGIAVMLRGENEDVLRRPYLRRLAREAFLRHFLLPRIDRFLFIGQENRRFFERRGIPAERLFYVPYSVDNSFFASTTHERDRIRAEVRAGLSLAADARIFIYTRKLRAAMRPLDAIEAFASSLPKLAGSTALVVCGDGELRSAAERVAAQRGEGRVRFVGYLDQQELRRHMLAADVMLNPTEEPWGCALNEGLACGLVMLSSDGVVGWPDMVQPGRNGLVHPLGDIEALAAAIVRLDTLPREDLTRMGTCSLAMAESLSFDVCAEGIWKAVESLP